MNSRKKTFLARELVKKIPRLSKSAVARHFGIARASLYWNSRQADKDQLLLTEVLRVMDLHPHYGHRRIALVLGRSKETIRRIMKKYGLRSRTKRRRQKYRATTSLNPPIPNRIKRRCPIMANAWWAGDFTILSFRGLALYVATVIDLYTREIVGVVDWAPSFSPARD